MAQIEAPKTVCTACGKEDMRKEDLGFTQPELVAYCKSPANCNAAHPNSLESTVRRGYQIPLINYTQAMAEYKAQSMLSGDMTEENLHAYELLNKSIGTRISDMETARFIVKVKKELNLTTSKAIAMIVDSFREYVESGAVKFGNVGEEAPTEPAPVKEEVKAEAPPEAPKSQDVF